MKAFLVLMTSAILLSMSTLAHAQQKYEVPFPRPVTPKRDTVSISFIGDVMMHAKQLNYDCSEFLSRLSPITHDADICVANMEFTLAGEPYTGYPAFSSPDSYAEYAATEGIDVFLTANNHILDKGQEGLRRTLGKYESMRRRGIFYTGTALDERRDTTVNPLIVACKGVRIALVNFTYGTNTAMEKGYPSVMRMDKERVGAMIERARRKKADFIIALPHWGNEYQLKHSKTQQEWAEWLVEQGVDAIIGAHPHVVQDSTHIKGVPVIYSMGNAVSNMSATNTRLELAVTVRIVRDAGERPEMLEPEIEFLWCTLPGNLIDNYATIMVSDYLGRREEWINASDYDNMTATLARVMKETGIKKEYIPDEKDHQARTH